jgi:hypothetical protein
VGGGDGAVATTWVYFGFGTEMPSRARVTMGCRGGGRRGEVGGAGDVVAVGIRRTRRGSSGR